MIDVYFMMDGKEKGDCVGGISLKDKHPNMPYSIWTAYKVFPITEKIVLFQKTDGEFCTTNGTYEHEMGTIKVEVIKGVLGDKWLHVNVTEK